jgi:hypothetical protein
VKIELKEKSKHQEYFEVALQNLIDQGNNIRIIATNWRPWIKIDFPEDFITAKSLFE